MAARDVAQQNWDAYVRARDSGHEQYIREARQFEDFYVGGGRQWNERDRQRLDAEGKPALEINMILSTVNAMLGERVNQSAEIRFQPSHGGAADLAEFVLTPLARHIQSDNGYQFVEGEVFADGIIQDRGYFDIRIDYDKDERGEIRIRSLDPMLVLPDPYARSYDTREWNEVITTRWMTLSEIEAEFGKEHRKKVELFATSTSGIQGYEYDCIERETRPAHYGDPDEVVNNDPYRDKHHLRVRIIERQYKKIGMQRVFVDPATGDIELIPDEMPAERVAELAERLRMGVREEPRRRVRWTISAGNHVLSDAWSMYEHFTVVGFFPYFRRGQPFGVVRNLISPQQQLNKAESQELHIINTTANSGWDIESGQLVNMTEQDLEERGAQTGLVLVRKPGTPPLAKIQPNSIPTGINTVARKAGASIRQISGVYDAVLGDIGTEVSGVKLDLQVKRGLTQFQVPFDNLNRTRKILGEIMYRLISQFYSEERVYYVADFNQPGAPIKPVEINKQMVDGTILNDVTVGEYAVSVEVGPSRETVQESQFAQALELRQAGVNIPDFVIIENSNLARRREVAEMLRKLQGFSEPTPEEQQLAQMRLQLEIQMAQAEVATAQAKAMLMQSQAAEAQASAQGEQADRQLKAAELQATFELEQRKLQQRWQELLANLDNKLQLAGLHTGVKSDLTHYQTLAKQTTEQQKMRTQLQQAAMAAARDHTRSKTETGT